MNYPSDTLAFNKAEILKVLQVIDENLDLGSISNAMLSVESLEFLNIHNPFNDYRKFLFNTPLLSLWESACIACNIDSAVLNQMNEDDLREKYPELNSAVTMLNSSIKMGSLQYHDYEISKQDLQKFLSDQGIDIIGFNKNADDESTSNSFEKENQELKAEINTLQGKLKNIESCNDNQFGSASIGFASVEDYQIQIAELRKENEKLKAENLQLSQNENAINSQDITLKNNDLLFVSVLMKMLQNEIKVSANKSQSKILQKIDDEHEHMKGLSKSRTEKVMQQANRLYKQLNINKMK